MKSKIENRKSKILWLSLLPAVLGFLAAGGEERLPIGEFSATRFEKPPVIDGKVSPGEWDRALTTSGLIAPFDHQMQEAETTVSFGFDRENFYFLFRCRRGEHEWKLYKLSRENDDYNFGEPTVEVWVTPPTLVPETYQSVINTYPAVLDQKMIPSRGYTSQGWKGNWKFGVSETDTEYIIEASIPIKDFGFDGVKNGDVWRFLLCRNCLGAKPRSFGSWSITQAFAEIPQHPRVHLMDDEAVVRLNGVTSFFTGKYTLPVTVVAPRATAAEVDVDLNIRKGKTPGEGDRVERQHVSVPAGGRKEVLFSGDVTALQKGEFTLTATKADKTLLFRQSFPFIVNGWTPRAPVRPANQPPPEELVLQAQYGPESNTLLVKADILDFPRREEAAGAEVRVCEPGGGKVLKRAPMRQFREWYAGAALSLEGLQIPVEDFRKNDHVRDEQRRITVENEKKKPGEAKLPLPELPTVTPKKVEVQVSVLGKDGKELRSASKQVELVRYSAEWMNNSVGVSEHVIPPWMPVRVAGGKVDVWNRTLELDALGLGRTIRNGGVAQLATPMRLVAVKDGKEIAVAGAAPGLQRLVETEADFSGGAEAAGLRFDARSQIEFDGFVKVDLDIAPAGKEPVRVDKLFLEVVLPAEEATHYCTTAGGWAAVHDVLPDHWTSQSTASGMLANSFVPYIWLTNSDRAFLWFADSDRGWSYGPDKAQPAQELRRENGKVYLRVNFFEIPTEVQEPRHIVWGWQTFPSRPLPPGWRATFCAQRDPVPHTRSTYFWADADWAVLWPYYCSPYPWSMDKSRSILLRTPIDSNFHPCVGSIAHSIGRYRDYNGNDLSGLALDWGASPGVIGNADVTASKGPNDFRLFHYQRWVQEARFRGLYVDENYLSLEENFLTGNAYWRPDGRLERAYNYIGLRDYFKRLKVMFYQNGVAEPNLWQHITSGAAYHSWFGDILMEGENVEPTDLTFDYFEVLPAGRMRAIASAVCGGGVMTMMCQSQRHATVYEPKHSHQFMGWVLAHDVLPDQSNLYPAMVEAGRLWREDVRFLPYWKPSPFTTSNEGCLVSAHATPGRALLWVVNTSRKDQDVGLAIDWTKAGLQAAKTMALHAETGAVIPLANDTLNLRVLQRDFVPVLLFQQEGLESGETFKAAFDHGPEADAAASCAVLQTQARDGSAGKPIALTEDGKGGRAASLANGAVVLRSHLHLNDAEGRLHFRALLPDKAQGSLLTIGSLEVQCKPGKTGELTLTQAPSRKDAGDSHTAAAAQPGAGWHSFGLSWEDGKVALTVDDKPALEMPLHALGLAPVGMAFQNIPNVVFGRTGNCLAVDDITCWRTGGGKAR